MFKLNMIENSSNKTIAKNTIFLYFRMMFTMIVSLFTSRVILQALGVDDYGIYQAVGGIVGFMGFLNSAFATGSSRFLTYAMGEGNQEKIKKTFSTNVLIHVGLGLVIVVLAESVGLWFLYNKMVIPVDRFSAAQWVFHISIFTAFINITQVPYTAAIMSHEKMSVYAYVSIVEVSLKLAICYMLYIGDFDKLILYAILFCVLNACLMIYYRYYCLKHFEETKICFVFDKSLFKQISAFSGWSFFANAAIALNNQGVLILLNMFFSPAVVAARAISLQVNSAAYQFVNNFRAAANPQITKRYAAGDRDSSKRLLLQSTKFSYYLMFLMALPIFFVAEPLLKMWLGVVPEYAVVFLQLIVIESLFQVFDTSFYQALYAKGRIRENALLSPTLGFLRFPLIYILFKKGFSPIALSWLSIANYALLGLVVKPLLLIKICRYKFVDILMVFRPCLSVTVVACVIPVLLRIFQVRLFTNDALDFFFSVIIAVSSVIVTIWLVGLDPEMRTKLLMQMRKRAKIIWLKM